MLETKQEAIRALREVERQMQAPVTVRRRAVLAISVTAFGAAGIAAAALVSPAAPELTVEIYLFVAAALVLVLVVLGVAKALPRAEPMPFQQPAAVSAIRSARVRRQCAGSSPKRPRSTSTPSSVRSFARLRQPDSPVTASRSSGSPIALGRCSGPQTWELVRPDREAPTRRLRPWRLQQGRAACDRRLAGGDLGGDRCFARWRLARPSSSTR